MASFTDNFNRADGSGLGAAWDVLTTTFDINGNAARGSQVTTNNVRYGSAVSSANHHVQATLSAGVASATSSGVMARMDTAVSEAALNCYLWRYNGTLTGILKCVAGSFTALGTAYTATLADGAVLDLNCNGSTITGYISATQRQQVTDTSVATGSRGGMRSGNTIVKFDDFTVADLAAAASFAPENRLIRRNSLLRR